MRGFAVLAALLSAVPAHAEPVQWQGRSMSLRTMERGIICEAGALTLTLDGDTLSGRIAGGADLAGTVKADGTIRMDGRKGALIYSFTGKRAGDIMQGSWIDAGSGCGGMWRAEPSEAPQ